MIKNNKKNSTKIQAIELTILSNNKYFDKQTKTTHCSFYVHLARFCKKPIKVFDNIVRNFERWKTLESYHK